MKKARLTGLILILSGIISCINLFSQVNFIPGSIITLTGDTLHGLIDYRASEKNPVTIRFRSDSGEPVKVYRPGEVKGFSVNQEQFVSAVVKIETSTLITNDLGYDPSFHFITDTVFLKMILGGYKGLFSYCGPEIRENFYVSTGGDYMLLEYKRYRSGESVGVVIRENKKYIGQLSLLMQDCPTISQELRECIYTRHSLQNLFVTYNNCCQDPVFYEAAKKKVKTEAGIWIAPTLTTLDFRSPFFPYLDATNFTYSPGLSAGISLNLIFPGYQEKLYMVNELAYTSYESSGKVLDYVNEEYYSLITNFIGASYVRYLVGLGYRYPIGKISLAANLGVSGALVLKLENSRITEKRFYSTESTTYDLALDKVRVFETGVFGSLAVNYGHFTNELRCELCDGMSPYATLASQVNRFSFIIRYRF